MRILIAPDKFKGSLDAAGVCRAIADGWRSVDPNCEIDPCPIADGGEGFVAALVAATNGRLETRPVTGPLPEMKVSATFGFLGHSQTAVIEMSAACGLALLRPDQRNPLYTTTFGVGELMTAAARMGAEKILLGLGGSATIDAGIGAAQAVGLPVLLKDGEILSDTEPLTGGDLEKVIFIKHGRGGSVDRIPIEAACDVTNPLCGPTGAAATFGPQKGATPEQVQWFDQMLKRLAKRTGKQEFAELPGAGAAGGMGFGLAAFFNARLRPGFDIVADAANLAARISQADLCITGEGRLDRQSLHGKAAIGVARLCRKQGVPCIAFVGSTGEGMEDLSSEGVLAVIPINEGGLTLEQSMSQAVELLRTTSVNVARECLHLGSTLQAIKEYLEIRRHATE